MKILHTADWHIGKMLYKYDLNEDLKLFFDWLIDYVTTENIDLLLVAGDIFDLANPSNRDIRFYYEVLYRLNQSKTKVIITGGNHDSISMLDAPKNILNSFQIQVVGGVPDQIEEEIIPIYDAENQLQCVVLAVPFLRDKDLRKSVSADIDQNKAAIEKAAIKAHYDQLVEISLSKYGADTPIIAMGHLFMQGAETSDSERDIHIGNLGGISSDIIHSRIDYMALGHIHKPQRIGKSDKIRYSGSPIFLDFSERNYEKQVIEIKIEQQKIIDIQSIKVPKNRELVKFSGDFKKIEQQLMHYQPENRLTALVELEIVEDQFDPSIINLQNELTEAAPFGNYKIIKTRLSFKNKLENIELLANHEHIMNFSPKEVFQKRLDAEIIDATLRQELMEAYHILLEEMQD
ncbi:MAG: exonuclease SbcCD subunit D C-terminal domain-containing protein [Saprospiraceae bacterium]|nr:exonuclease SbcCD subunit D C-terminal domain-containing protein [Saprospiraceae bacterium]